MLALLETSDVLYVQRHFTTSPGSSCKKEHATASVLATLAAAVLEH